MVDDSWSRSIIISIDQWESLVLGHCSGKSIKNNAITIQYLSSQYNQHQNTNLSQWSTQPTSIHRVHNLLPSCRLPAQKSTSSMAQLPSACWCSGKLHRNPSTFHFQENAGCEANIGKLQSLSIHGPLGTGLALCWDWFQAYIVPLAPAVNKPRGFEHPIQSVTMAMTWLLQTNWTFPLGQGTSFGIPFMISFERCTDSGPLVSGHTDTACKGKENHLQHCRGTGEAASESEMTSC